MSEYDHDTFEWRRELRALKQNRLNGWGMGWFRNTRAGKIGGVAAGLADSWGLEHYLLIVFFVLNFGSVIIATSKQLLAGSFSTEKSLKVLITSLIIF